MNFWPAIKKAAPGDIGVGSVISDMLLAFRLWILSVIVVKCRVSSIILKCGTKEVINVVEPLDIEYPGGGRLYENNETCLWRFKGYGPLLLEFTEMDLENDGKDKCFDYVFAGGKMDCRGFFTLFEAEEDMELEFKSDHKGRRKGFKATIDNKCPRFSKNCDFHSGSEEDAESLLVYTIANTSRTDSLLIGKDNLEGTFVEGYVKLEMALFGDSRGSTGCYECDVKKPTSQIPSCHSQLGEHCEWILDGGVRSAVGYADTRGSVFVLSESEAEFATLATHLNPRNGACIYIEYFTNDTARFELLAQRKDGERTSLIVFESELKGTWAIQKMVRTLPEELVGVDLGLVLRVELPEGDSVLVNKIYGCDPLSEEDRYLLVEDDDFAGKVYSFGGGRRRESGICENGGVWGGERCICPAGTNGTECQSWCPPHRYGPRCEARCPGSCAGVIFCKSGLGCHCAPGFKGRYCSLLCDSHEFGVDCAEQCLGCADDAGCDSITGVCTGACIRGYIPPLCSQKYPHVRNPPKFTPLYTEVMLHSRLNGDTTEGDLSTVAHYQFQYRRLHAIMWNNTGTRRVPENGTLREVIGGLSPGMDYETRLILLTEMKEGYEGPDVPVASFSTLCSGYNPLDVTDTAVTESSIYLEWEDRYKRKLACSTEETLVQIEVSGTWVDHVVDEYFVNITELLPGTRYDIRLRPAYAPDRLFTRLTVATVSTYFGDVTDLRVTQVSSTDFNLEWKSKYDNGTGVYAVAYKCLRVLADLQVNCANDSDTKETRRNKLKVWGLSPYRTYEVLVRELPGKDYSRTVVTTEEDLPKVAPQLVTLENRSNGVLVEWAPPSDCSLCNGRLSGYYYKTSTSGFRYAYYTKESRIVLAVEEDRNYEIHIYLKNTLGRNEMFPLIVNFQKPLPGNIRNITVYKRNGKSLGIKWSEPERTARLYQITVEGSTLREHTPGVRCHSWPDQFCYTVQGLQPNRSYTVGLVGLYDKPVVMDMIQLEGPKVHVTGTTRETIPDPPVDLTANVTETTATLTWAPPDKANGILREFVIQVEKGEGDRVANPEQVLLVEEERPRYSAQLVGLDPATDYRVLVMGVTVARGPSAAIRIATRPPPPLSVPPPLLVNFKIDWTEAHPRRGRDPYATTPYLLLLLRPSDNTVEPPQLQAVLNEKIPSGFQPIAEYEEDEPVQIELQTGRGSWAVVGWPTLVPGSNYTFAAVAVSRYNNSYNVLIRRSLTFAA